MPNPFLSPKAFNPDLAAKVAEAYERNQRNSRAFDILTGNLSVRSLAGIIKEGTVKAKKDRAAGLAGFDQLSSPDVRHNFEETFTAAEELFGRIDLAIPTIEQYISAGTNLGVLSTCYEHMKDEGLEPTAVLSPNLDLISWKQIYHSLKVDLEVNGLGPLSSNELSVASLMVDQWDNAATLPDSVPTVPLPHTESYIGETLHWSLRLIPGTSRSGTSVGRGYSQSVHPTVGEYLSLQAIRLQAHQKPLDTHTSTWLNGSFDVIWNNDPVTPIGYWDLNSKCLSISLANISRQDGDIGARSPAWE